MNSVQSRLLDNAVSLPLVDYVHQHTFKYTLKVLLQYGGIFKQPYYFVRPFSTGQEAGYPSSIKGGNAATSINMCLYSFIIP